MRREDWPSRLHDVIEAARETPFAWGSHDCCTFAAACVEAVTGRNVWPASRRYTTEQGAYRALRGLGDGYLTDTIDDILGPRKAPFRAGRGDIVAVHTPTGPGIAVVDLTGEWVVAPAQGGLSRLHLVEAFAAWTVD